MATFRFVRAAAALALGAFTLASVAFILAVGLGPRLGHYRTLTVLSGSMRPAIEPGSVVVIVPIRPEEVRVGDVVTFQAPVAGNPIVTHRVIELAGSGPHPVMRTQGDANETPDPWRARIEGTTAWRVIHVVPKIGFAISWLRNPMVHKLTVTVAPLLFLVASLMEIWGRPPKPRPDRPLAATGSLA